LQSRPNQVLLTFDVEGPPQREDFFEETSLRCLKMVVELLEKNDFRGIFFITGSAAERIRKHSGLVEHLSRHEVGYHSASHSVKPRIFEYTDITSYEEAVASSFEREKSHINLENGQVDGNGGIMSLRQTFPHNSITCFRAPFLAWSPPHLEALRKLGIVFDFSSDISRQPLTFRGITFYPSPLVIDGVEATFVHRGPEDIFPKPLVNIFLQRAVTVLLMHPSSLISTKSFVKNGESHVVAGDMKTKLVFSFLRLLFDWMRFLQEANFIEVTSSLSENWEPLNVEKVDVERIYQASVRAPKRLFNSDPKFIRSHYVRFFGQDKKETEFTVSVK